MATTPTSQKVGTFGSAFIRGSLEHLKLPESTKTLIQDSWRESTRSQYNSVLRGWGSFCLERQTNPTSPSIEDVLVYLTSLYEQGLQYNTICTARSALSGILHIPGVPKLSDHPLIQRLLKGIYHNRPPKPRYTCIWDTSKMINYLASLHNESLDFKMISYKCVTLLTILAGQRISTLHKFRLSLMQNTDSMTLFQISDLLKHSTPRYRGKPIKYRSYPHNKELCPVHTIRVYISRRNTLLTGNDNDSFFCCHRKPYGPASSDTLARWVKDTMKLAGIDVSIFGAHSCRAASTSKAFQKGHTGSRPMDIRFQFF